MSTAVKPMQHKKRRHSVRTRMEIRRAYLILLPFFLYIALWNLVPLVYGLSGIHGIQRAGFCAPLGGVCEF